MSHTNPSPLFPPPFDKSCADTSDWQTMRKSDIRYPRATADLRPAEGHAATKIKCQARGNMQREEMWPTWHNHTSLCHCPERAFSFVRQADWPDWQERYGYFPWQPAEPAGILKGEVDHVMGLRSSIFFIANMGAYHLQRQILHCHFYFPKWISVFKAPVLSSMLMPPYVSQGLKYPLKWFVSICPLVHLLMCNEKRIFWNGVKLLNKWSVFLRQSTGVNVRTMDLFPVSSVSSRSCDLYLSITRQENSFSLPHLAFTNPEKR